MCVCMSCDNSSVSTIQPYQKKRAFCSYLPPLTRPLPVLSSHQMGSPLLYSMEIHKQLSLLLSVVLLLSSMQAQNSAEGRPTFHMLLEGDETATIEGAMIGSRPPTCKGRCSSCGPCEAVQVPAAPQDKVRVVADHSSQEITSSREDNSNYKPLSWKCKCGSSILNP